jgi:hypothetical protein
MANDDLLTCPLCQGHSHVSRNELIGRLTDRNLREKIETYLAELVQLGEPAAVRLEPAQVQNFHGSGHSWDPQLPMWRRSPKE